MTVSFDNGDMIQYSPSKMNIGGLLVGIRTFDFTDTSNFLFYSKLIYLIRKICW